MAVSEGSFLKGFFSQAQAVGAKAISSDFAFEIEGFEDMWLQVKQAPWPVMSSAGEIEIPSSLGTTMAQPQQAKVYLQGPIALMETVAGNVSDLLISLIAQGGVFNAKIYEGTPEKYIRYKPISSCFIVMDAADRDWENRTQVLTFQGTLHYHYFGDDVAGNSNGYK